MQHLTNIQNYGCLLCLHIMQPALFVLALLKNVLPPFSGWQICTDECCNGSRQVRTEDRISSQPYYELWEANGGQWCTSLMSMLQVNNSSGISGA
jgi:hypothetical protein